MSFGQGGPGWGPGDQRTPDWNALADTAAASRARRRRWALIGGGAAATVAVAAIVAVAVVQGGGGGTSDDPTTALPTPADLPSGPSQPEPDFTEAPPPPNPYEFISDPDRDTAPRTAESFFPAETIEVEGRTFTRVAAKSTDDCSSAAREELAKVLTDGGCTELHRATFTRDGVAITVGIAVLPSEDAAVQAKEDARPYVAPLTAGPVPEDFCRYSACRSSANAYGRYTYFTLSGYLDGTNVTPEEEKALNAGRDLAAHAQDRIHLRGEEQAAAAATAPPAG
ncbi:hypothetical protein [Streptomyces sp. GSL17-111]|uniref:hypothetical protein n=1 Tax=Streptomyces sp. GSL17-111 TaxID=3121596 RepID=UPI0030F40DC9